MDLIIFKYPQVKYTGLDKTEVAENLVYVEIYFEDFHYQSIEEYPAYQVIVYIRENVQVLLSLCDMLQVHGSFQIILHK